MSGELAPTREAELIRLAELDEARRYSDAEVTVARKAKLSSDELVPLMRRRLDAWREWGIALGAPETGRPLGNVTGGDVFTGAERNDRERARKIAAVPEDAFEAHKAQTDPDELTLSALFTIARDERREDLRERNRELVKQAPRLAADGETFPTIMLDPPWDWGDEGDQDQLGRARPVYATMPIEAIAAEPVEDLAQDDAHLYLWITNRSLPKGFALLEHWGFRYITALTWTKPTFGMGNYFRGSTEHVLFGVRGSLSLLRADVGTYFTGGPPRRKHSEKPDEFYELVESCSPGPWLEWPARRKRNGWVTVGAEVAENA